MPSVGCARRRHGAMMSNAKSHIPEIVGKYGDDLLTEWLRYQRATVTARRDLMNEVELREQSRRFLDLFRKSLSATNGAGSIDGPAWTETRQMLADVSRSRAKQGFTPRET